MNQNKRIKMEKIKLFEMFAGYGGSSFSLKKAKIEFEPIGFSEIDKYAIQCYQQNHKDNTRIDGDEIRNYEDATTIDPKDIPDFDLLTGGFPCQSFSSAGKGLGELDTRGTLFNDIIRIAEFKKPKYMLLENVKGLTNKRHKETFNKILSELQRIGYYVHWGIFNSKDFGIPQNRERVFFICFRNHLEFMNFVPPKKEELKLSIYDLLDIDVSIKFNLSEKALKSFTNTNFNAHKKRLQKSSVCSTLLARDYKDPKCIEVNKVIRRLTPNEYFKLMGFTSNEINLTDLSNTQQYKLAGNGWDINLVSKIFTKMFSLE